MSHSYTMEDGSYVFLCDSEIEAARLKGGYKLQGFIHSVTDTVDTSEGRKFRFTMKLDLSTSKTK